jgi:hypothetical protein
MGWGGRYGRRVFQHGATIRLENGYRWAITANYTGIFIRHI